MANRLKKPCPACRGSRHMHVGGTCYGCQKWKYGHYCGWVALGTGNRWNLRPGWYDGAYLNMVAAKMENPPFTAFID